MNKWMNSNKNVKNIHFVDRENNNNNSIIYKELYF